MYHADAELGRNGTREILESILSGFLKKLEMYPKHKDLH